METNEPTGQEMVVSVEFISGFFGLKTRQETKTFRLRDGHALEVVRAFPSGSGYLVVNVLTVHFSTGKRDRTKDYEFHFENVPFRKLEKLFVLPRDQLL